MSAVPTFYSLQVVQLRIEGLNGKAITLHVPEALRQRFAFKPGQYMVVRATITGKSCQRSYSVCSTPERLYTTGEIDMLWRSCRLMVDLYPHTRMHDTPCVLRQVRASHLFCP
jgi:hypothetical protein